MKLPHRLGWALWMIPVPMFAQSAIYFDESATDRVRMGNTAFEVSLSKTNGAILAITDKSASQSLTLGSRNGCLWVAVSSTASASWGCTFTATGANRFAYSWAAGTSTLTLTYTPAAGTQNVSATVQIVVSSQPYFDMTLAVKNQTGDQITSLSFPQDLVFNASAISAAYFRIFLRASGFCPDSSPAIKRRAVCTRAPPAPWTTWRSKAVRPRLPGTH